MAAALLERERQDKKRRGAKEAEADTEETLVNAEQIIIFSFASRASRRRRWSMVAARRYLPCLGHISLSPGDPRLLRGTIFFVLSRSRSLVAAAPLSSARGRPLCKPRAGSRQGTPSGPSLFWPDKREGERERLHKEGSLSLPLSLFGLKGPVFFNKYIPSLIRLRPMGDAQAPSERQVSVRQETKRPYVAILVLARVRSTWSPCLEWRPS